MKNIIKYTLIIFSAVIIFNSCGDIIDLYPESDGAQMLREMLEIAEVEKYFSQISLSELLVVNRIANEEINHRIDKHSIHPLRCCPIQKTIVLQVAALMMALAKMEHRIIQQSGVGYFL